MEGIERTLTLIMKMKMRIVVFVVWFDCRQIKLCENDLLRTSYTKFPVSIDVQRDRTIFRLTPCSYRSVDEVAVVESRRKGYRYFPRMLKKMFVKHFVPNQVKICNDRGKTKSNKLSNFPNSDEANNNR